MEWPEERPAKGLKKGNQQTWAINRLGKSRQTESHFTRHFAIVSWRSCE
jgi:hypothetical protein